MYIAGRARSSMVAGAALLARFLLAWLCSCVALAEDLAETRLAALVVTPESSGPASVIYDRVVNGIEQNPALEVTRVTLPQGAELQWLQDRVNAQSHQIVIAIGNQSYRLCAELDSASTVVAGGISGKPNGVPTLSLTGEPAASIERIKRIAPEVNDLRLVYSQDMNGWWYEQAVRAGARYGIEVHGYRAEDIKEGVKLYEQMVSDAKPRQTAIWIPLRSIVPSKTILPFLLEKAWAKKIPVVSNNPSHTRLGGLMAVYPEHESMGVQLAAFALAHHRGNPGVTQITGTEDLRIAVNVRTGAHMGLRFSQELRKTFDKTFPAGR